MRRIFFIFLFNIILGNGKYGDSFLNIGTSARDIGLGQAIVADMGNASGSNVTPASIANINSKTIYFLMLNQFGLAEYFSSGMVLPLQNKQYASINITGLIVDDIELRPDLVNIGSYEQRRDIVRELFAQGYDSFSNTETAITASFVKMFSGTINMGLNFSNYDLPIGINSRLIKKNLHDQEAYGIGFDIGGIFMMQLESLLGYSWAGKFAYGISLNNIFGTHLIWSNKIKDVIPMQMVYGLSYEQPLDFIKSKILFLHQRNNIYPNNTQFGVELSVLENLFVRFGNQVGVNQGGLGIIKKINSSKKIRFDYSFGGYDLGDVHRLGFELQF